MSPYGQMHTIIYFHYKGPWSEVRELTWARQTHILPLFPNFLLPLFFYIEYDEMDFFFIHMFL